MKAFFDKIKQNDFYKMWFKDALPYVTGAVFAFAFPDCNIFYNWESMGSFGSICQLGSLAV